MPTPSGRWRRSVRSVRSSTWFGRRRTPTSSARSPTVPPPPAAANPMFLDTVDERAAEAMLAHLRESTAQLAVVQLRVLGGAVARVPADATAYAHRSRRMIATVAALDTEPVHDAWARDVP